MKKSLLILVLLTFAAIGAYFAYEYARSLKTQDSLANTLTVGWIGPLTGPTQSLGVEGLDAIQMAIKNYNEKKEKTDPKINLLVANVPLGSPAALQAYQDMLKKKTKLFFVLTSEDTLTLAKNAKKDGIIIINPLNNDHSITNLSPNVFLIAKRTELLFVPIVHLMLKKNEHKALVLYSTSEGFTRALAQYFQGAFTAAGGKVIMQPYSASTVTDFKPLLEEGVRNKVDAYIFIGSAEMGRAVKQARAMGITSSFYSSDFINSPDVRREAGDALENMIFMDFTYLDGNALLAKPLLNQFENNFHRKLHLEWSVLQAHDAVNLALRAIHFANTTSGEFDENVRDFLSKVRDYEGVSGNISIRADGSSEGIVPGVYIFKNGKAEKIRP